MPVPHLHYAGRRTRHRLSCVRFQRSRMSRDWRHQRQRPGQRQSENAHLGSPLILDRNAKATTVPRRILSRNSRAFLPSARARRDHHYLVAASPFRIARRTLPHQLDTDFASAAQTLSRRSTRPAAWKGREVQHPMTNELRDKARALGLDRLTDKHLEQFERATTGMERHLKRLPRGMPPAQEPAHVYRAKRQTP